MSQDDKVMFSALVPFAGLVGGVLIAVGLPYVTLVYGGSGEDGTGLSTAAQTGIIILALLIGGAVAFCSAFFGIVIPRRVSGGPEHGRFRDRHHPNRAADTPASEGAAGSSD